MTVEDRLAVIETCTRMAFHADQREWERLAGVFAEKVTLDYTSLAAGEPAELTPAEIVAAWTNALGGYDATQHLITNHLVDIDGDTAVCTAAFQATHRLATPHGSPLWTLGGTYRFGLVRTAGRGWRINAVVMTTVWADGNQHLPALAAARMS
ncbi:nuclear transport factor 2 family protein [Streptomyces flavidovirens]|uniref:nuclear transport factor 2 family protein n=1 Tax=Streptomyces flavidovirens TaxID=67298 RepID=UPI00041776D9|nr:nuclear transport factor 2 family protein [Streptomyces flavidovirens]